MKVDKTDAKSRWVNKLNSMVMLSKKVTFWYVSLHDFHMWDRAQFNHNLMTQFNKRKRYRGVRKIKL